MDRIFYDNQEYAKYSDKFLKRFNLADQAAYDALPAATKNDDSKVFFIKDNPVWKWDFTKSMIDEIKSAEATIVSGNGYSDSEGYHFGDEANALFLCQIDMRGRILEIDVPEMHVGDSAKDVSFVCNTMSTSAGSAYYNPTGTLKHVTKNQSDWTPGWYAYLNSSKSASTSSKFHVRWTKLSNNKTIFNGKTVRIVYSKDGGSFKLWLNDKFIQKLTGAWFRIDTPSTSNVMLMIGEPKYGGNLSGTIISGVRIYDNKEAD